MTLGAWGVMTLQEEDVTPHGEEICSLDMFTSTYERGSTRFVSLIVSRILLTTAAEEDTPSYKSSPSGFMLG